MDEATGLYDYGARWYDPAVARWGQIDPLADQYAPYSPYNYVLGNPISLIDPDGMAPSTGGDPGKIIAVFYHGGPTGGGKTTTPSRAGTTGQIYNYTASSAGNADRGFAGRVIAPGATSASGVENGLGFIKDNYNEGDQVIVYGYSYGVDVATDLSAKLGEMGIPVDLLITVDGSDGPMQNSTVNTEISDNVDTNLNIYQTDDSGVSATSRSTGVSTSNSSSNSSSSDSGTSNFPGSNGGPNSPKDKYRTHVINMNVSGPGVTHGNIQSKQQATIQHVINNHITQPKKD